MKLTEKLYDVMFMELLMYYECYLPIAEKLGIPVIGTSTLRSHMQADHAVGVPNNPAFIPVEIAECQAKVDMSFVERVQNLWNHLLVYFTKKEVSKRQEEFHLKYFPEYVMNKKKVSLVFFNNHPTFLPRPTIPNAIDVGGIHVQPANPLPEVSFQKFLLITLDRI